MDGPRVTLGPGHAQDFSLAIHELVTNAVKYGAFSNAAGEVKVSWQVEANGHGKVLKFRWCERRGPPVIPPTREGFGTSLLKSVLGSARLQYEPEGFTCEVDFSLSSLEDRGGASD
jgi:two-component sensor histidine kinase